MRLIISIITLITLTIATQANEGERVTVKGELIDTWCYYSGVMGSTDAVTGSAHHTCALWCSAGGIPVGLLTEEGDVYMIIKIDEDNQNNDTQLSLASHTITADGMMYERDGIKYITVTEIKNDHGITLKNHEDYGQVPGFAIPKKVRKQLSQ